MSNGAHVKIAIDDEVIVDPSRPATDEEAMARRSATFKEVAISLSAPTNRSKDNDDISDNKVPEETDDSDNAKTTLRPWSFINRVKSLPKIASKMQGRRGSNRSSSSAVTLQDFDSDSAAEKETSPSREMAHLPPPGKKHSLTPSQINLLAIGRPLSQLKKVIASATKQKKHHGDESPSKDRSRANSENSRIISFQSRIDNWAKTLTTALQEDVEGRSMEAFDAYRKFNLRVTKEAIYNYEQFTCDQQKLLRQVMQTLDRRCRILERHITTSSFDSSNSSQQIPPQTSLNELRQCIRLLTAVKTIGSTRTMPVVLVYRERHHRKKHRDEQKGKSNKVVFAKEKRDFLQMLGLPGVMVTEQGIDYSIKPHIQDNVNGIPIKMPKDPVSNDYQAVSQLSSPERSKEAEVSFTSETRNILEPSRKPPQKEESKMSLVDHCLGFRKRLMVSPERVPELEDNNGNHYRSNQTISIGEWTDVISSDTTHSDTLSNLSCDSCSSDESIESDYEIENPTDTAVLASYVHHESILPPPFHRDEGTYIVLCFEKIGVKKTSLISPFLRISIKDSTGRSITMDQETRAWDVINDHYLRAPSLVYIQQSLESIPEDCSIFFEMRHFIQSKRKVSTHCYTFLEKHMIRTGEFICEM